MNRINKHIFIIIVIIYKSIYSFYDICKVEIYKNVSINSRNLLVEQY